MSLLENSCIRTLYNYQGDRICVLCNQVRCVCAACMAAKDGLPICKTCFDSEPFQVAILKIRQSQEELVKTRG